MKKLELRPVSRGGEAEDGSTVLLELTLPTGEVIAAYQQLDGEWETTLALPEGTRLAATYGEEAVERWPRLLSMGLEERQQHGAMAAASALVGQTVRLKSGGRVMATGRPDPGNQTIECWWWGVCSPESKFLPCSALEPVDLEPRLDAEKAGLLTARAAELHGEWIDAGLEFDDINWLLDQVAGRPAEAHPDAVVRLKRENLVRLTVELLEAMAP